MDKLYTIAEISRITGIPPSTVAYYRDRFQQYFPTVGKGKKRRYKEPVVEVVRLIGELSKDSRPQEQIISSLQANFQQFHEVQEEPQHITTTNQQAPEYMQYLAASLDRVADQSERIEQMEKKIDQLEKKLEQQQEKKNLIQRLLGK